jgi:Integrase core domain/Chromo (CHRromatin Organisation MOdifier) domain
MNQRKIQNIYFDIKHPAGFGTFSSLRRYLGSEISNQEIKNFLEGQESYTMHASRVKKFKRDFVFVSNIDDVWGVDLCDMRKYKRENNNYTFLLCVIDVLSKFAWVRCLKDKTALSVKLAFENIILKSGRQPIRVHCDKGKEFVGSKFTSYLRSSGIEIYHTENSDIKVSVCERFIRTFKTKLWRYFTNSGDNRYVDIYQDIIDSYNSSHHTSIGDAPKNVTENNFMSAWHKLYDSKLLLPGAKPKYNIGDYVRISKEKSVFTKGYSGNWSQEIFEIIRVINRRPIMYELVDLNKEIITGRFYEKEIQKVQIPKFHKIDKILKKRFKHGSLEYLVSWKGYPSSFDSWIKESEFKKGK